MPGSTIDTMIADVEGVERANVPSVTNYQYSLKPLSIDRKIQSANLDQQQQLLMHLVFIIGMRDLGYRQSPVDWFIKDEAHRYQHQFLKFRSFCNLRQS